MVGPTEWSRDAMSAADPALNLSLDFSTVGSLSDAVPDVICRTVIAALREGIGAALNQHEGEPA